MKLSTSIIVVVLTLGVAFLAYSNNNQTPPEPLQANIVESLPDEEPGTQTTSQNVEPTSQVEVASTEGLDEEYSSILDGYAEIQSDFNRLEPQKTATGAGN